MRLVTDDERRARLAVRHALAPAFRADSPEAVTRAMTVLHATEPATVHLACRARFDACTVADLDRALYADRSLVKQLAMRRTLFVFPRDLLPAVWPSASARVAGAEQARVTRDVVRSGMPADWLTRARAEVLDLLADVPEGHTAGEIRKAVPMIDVRIQESAGGQSPVARVLTHLGLTADVVRGVNTGRWHTSRPRWTLMSHWLGAVPPALDATAGYRELVRRWLVSFGPGTEDDLVWWLGSTKSVVRAALAALDAVAVTLAGGETGWLLPDDAGEVPDPGPWVALLPVLDPTVMGWKSRDFYLGPHRADLFDRTGNAGTTAWANGRIVGCWTQDPAGVVEVRLLEKVPPWAARALRDEGVRLTEWLAGVRVPTGYASPAMRATPAPA
ncbi:winged helix DNA-binding domain-containing protein [Actinoplanes sp. KI2]|uniref:winged helix DNA-binding domain-containing protein n=1 Tax=Actinoplanes sp. KI2 TaxID=2983315 RepID=UPI0021D58534|nr:winged helix DNA-binding domain-containing protein [Actinoplanes sp. KI2]MCU7729981.1 winged helix DNA-binding domain-containing protein [Actinoplanes sp. KI2]